MLQPRSNVGRGFVAGVIGAGSVALWFLIVDTIAGRPFFTPAVLGSAVFLKLRDPTMVTIGFEMVLAYTVIHVLAFLVTGIVVAAILAEVQKTPAVLWLLVEFFVVLEFAFYAVVGLVFTPLLAELAWINVAVGNLIAAAGMGYYFWHTHRPLRQPSGGADDQDRGEL